MVKRLFVLLSLLSLAAFGFGQDSVVHWTGKLVPEDARAGEAAQIQLTATVDEGWHIYSMKVSGGPFATTLTLQPSKAVTADGNAVEPQPKVIMDPNFEKELGLFEKEAVFAVPVRISKDAKGAQKVVVEAAAQACNDSMCNPPTTEKVAISFTVAPGETRTDHIAAMTAAPEQPGQVEEPPASGSVKGTAADQNSDDAFIRKVKESEGSGNLLAFIGFAFSAGLLALLTPCVFPMIPITVSYFAKQKTEGGKTSVRGPVAYCLGIMGTFTGLGLLVTAIAGPTGLNNLAANAYLNIGLAILFVFLALSLFGVYEIQLPSSLVNSMNSKARGDNPWAPVFLGLTFSLTTFTCTVPFVGTLLAGAASQKYFYPAVGMLSFSLAFALPFFLLALFPQYLAKLPKSGSWLTAVKAFMGFLELAAALKFLSNADLQWSLEVLTRPVFLAIWAAILSVAAFWLFGWLNLPKEGSAKIGWLRRGFGVVTLVAAIACFGSIRGTSMGEFEAFLPPDPYPGKSAAVEQGSVAWLHNWEEAVNQAKTAGKPIFVNFTGVTCTNCRWMEKNMIPRKAVADAINDMVPVELYTDRPQDKENQKLQQKLTGTVALPVYIVVTPDGKVLSTKEGRETDQSAYIGFIEQGRRNFGAVASR